MCLCDYVNHSITINMYSKQTQIMQKTEVRVRGAQLISTMELCSTHLFFAWILMETKTWRLIDFHFNWIELLTDMCKFLFPGYFACSIFAPHHEFVVEACARLESGRRMMRTNHSLTPVKISTFSITRQIEHVSVKCVAERIYNSQRVNLDCQVSQSNFIARKMN